MPIDNEPRLEDIDDYDNKESPQKRRTIYLVILFILIVGSIYTGFKYSFSEVDDYVGTKDKPGINTSKAY